jgi:hypothetical protein
MGRGQGAAALASLRQCGTAAAGCTGDRRRAAPKGNRNAFGHGRYSAKAIANRREVATLIRAMRALAAGNEEVESSDRAVTPTKPPQLTGERC